MHWHAIGRSARGWRHENTQGSDGAREIPHASSLRPVSGSKASDHTAPRADSTTVSTVSDATRVNTPVDSPQHIPIKPIDEVQAILSLYQLVNGPTEDLLYTDNDGDHSLRSSMIDHSGEPSTTDDIEQHNFLQVDIPNAPSGISTFDHERAMRNRIQRDTLYRGAVFDKHKYTPTFLHDCLMLPGSLANVIGKQSPLKLIRRMTPALLPGFQTYAHPQSQQPCLLQSPKPEEYVQGMLLFGQGREARDCIHEHYHPYTRKVKVQVEVELLSLDADGKTCPPLRKKIWVNAWVWSDVSGISASLHAESKWTLDGYLSGSLGLTKRMRVVDAPFIGEDHSDDDGNNEDGYSCVRKQTDGEMMLSKRGGPWDGWSKPLAPFGNLDYERSKSAIGKW